MHESPNWLTSKRLRRIDCQLHYSYWRTILIGTTQVFCSHLESVIESGKELMLNRIYLGVIIDSVSIAQGC
jgi:hypothetical protein